MFFTLDAPGEVEFAAYNTENIEGIPSSINGGRKLATNERLTPFLANIIEGSGKEKKEYTLMCCPIVRIESCKYN